MCARPISLAWPGGVVSFTFDDFPKTALTTGGSILERYGVRGTYYASLKLAGTETVVGPMFDPQDVGAAHNAGHEIGCHTYAHLDCDRAAKSLILTEVRDNAAAVSAIIQGFVPSNFAYPYGSVSPTAKRVVGPRFSSCRGIRKGINHGIVDLADLLAMAVYDVDFDEVEIRRMVDHNRSIAGWLIFFTHDVVETPSRYGCKPGQLESVVAYAAKDTAILPVREVIAGLRVTGQSHSPNLRADQTGS